MQDPPTFARTLRQRPGRATSPRPLRIAVVTETYPPEVNGVAATLARIVEGLHERGHAMQLVRPRQSATDLPRCGSRFDELLMRALPIPHYPHLKMGLPSKGALLRAWSAHRPDIVHVATEGPLGWSALRAAETLRLPVSSDFRTNFHAYSKHYGMTWLAGPILRYLRHFHNRTWRTMVPTEALRCELAGHGFEGLSVLARGVDTQRFDPARRSEALRTSWGAQPADLVVLTVGRLAAEKNLETLVRAFDAIRRRQPRARLVLVGDGPARVEMQRRCPDAVFAGLRRGDDLAAHYASGDLFLFPSLTETFGNVTPEAMASGLPMVAFDYAAAAEWIRPREDGMLAPFGDDDSFVQAAELLASDRSLRLAMGARARAAARGRGWDQIVRDFDATLWSLLPVPPPGRCPAGTAAVSRAWPALSDTSDGA